MTTDSEWYGEPHTLTVTSVTPPAGPLDDGELEYEITHPPTCTKKIYTYEFATYGGESPTVEEWDCGLAQHEAEAGLASSLKYSGTPVTEPGTYRIQSWGRKTYYRSAGAYEYDGGIGIVEAAP
jgi:hypothetical protein